MVCGCLFLITCFHSWTSVFGHAFKLDTSHLTTEEILIANMKPVRKSQVQKFMLLAYILGSFHHTNYKFIIYHSPANDEFYNVYSHQRCFFGFPWKH